MSRRTFEVLLQSIAVPIPSIVRGRIAVTPEKHLLISIWFIAHQDTIHRMADRFCVTDSSILRCRDKVFKIVWQYLKQKFVYFPEDNNVKAKIIADFRLVHSFQIYWVQLMALTYA